VPGIAALLLTASLFAAPAPTPAPTPGPLERGETFLGHKQYEKAEAQLRKAVEQNPTSARAHGNLALALLAQRKNREAVDAARLAAAFGPKTPEARYIFGLALAADGRPVDAAREFERAVALKPGETAPLAALAAAYAAAEDERTAATYEKLLALRPADPKIRAELAEYLWRTEKIDEGNRVIAQAIEAFPTNAELHVRYGRSLTQQDRPADAARALEKARSLGSRDASTFALLAGSYELAGDAQAAQTVLAEGVRAHPANASLRHDLGRLWLAEGRAEEALPELEEAARSSPGSVEMQLDLGRALEATGRLDAAEQAYRRVIRLAPNLPGAHYSLGRLLQRQGKKDEAERELAIHHSLYERGRQLVSAADARDAATSLAWAELNAGKAANALARFQALPESPESLKGQALAFQRLQRPRDAVRALERAHALAPEDHRIELLLVTERSRAEEQK
jgi:Flp pilus assembly protein TadD